MPETNNPAAEAPEEAAAPEVEETQTPRETVAGVDLAELPMVDDLEAPEYSDEEYEQMMALYDETLQDIDEGEIVSGVVLRVEDRDVLVDVGFKSEGSIPVDEFGGPEYVRVGDHVDVFLESIENQDGQIVLSKSKADFMKVWHKIKAAYDSGEIGRAHV